MAHVQKLTFFKERWWSKQRRMEKEVWEPQRI